MRCKLAGYVIDLPVARKLAEHLGLEDAKTIDEDLDLTYPFDSYLVEHKLMHVKSAAIFTPGKEKKKDPEYHWMKIEDAIMFIVRHAWAETAQSDVSLPEREKDRQVKQYLIEHGNLKEDEIRWIEMWDNAGISRTGFTPKVETYKPIKFNVVNGEEMMKLITPHMHK